MLQSAFASIMWNASLGHWVVRNLQLDTMTLIKITLTTIWHHIKSTKRLTDVYTNEEHNAMLRLNAEFTAAVEVELDEYILDGLLADAILVAEVT